MLHPVFDHFTTVTVVATKLRPRCVDLSFRLFGFYPLGSILSVIYPENSPESVHRGMPYWWPRWRGFIDTASIPELQRVAALLRRKPKKAEAEARALTRLEEIIEAVQTYASHPGTTTVPTTAQ